ncbi:MAG TPA: hypothetical protein VI322_05805 [Candidatus Saccharimonadia bacterium]
MEFSPDIPDGEIGELVGERIIEQYQPDETPQPQMAWASVLAKSDRLTQRLTPMS